MTAFSIRRDTDHRFKLGSAPMDVHCLRMDECQYVRGHDGMCSPLFERQLIALRHELELSQEQAEQLTGQLNEVTQEREVLTDLIERLSTRDEEEAASATMAMAERLRQELPGAESGDLVALAMDLIEAARAHLRDEFKKTLAKNLVEERDRYRAERDELERRLLGDERLRLQIREQELTKGEELPRTEGVLDWGRILQEARGNPAPTWRGAS